MLQTCPMNVLTIPVAHMAPVVTKLIAIPALVMKAGQEAPVLKVRSK